MENINVYIRLKPTPSSPSPPTFQINSPSLYNTKTNETFTFDSIIPASTSNETIFTTLIKDTLSFLFKGINLSILAYGQTSTGKTFTMKGKHLNGIIPLSIKTIFSLVSDSSITKHTIRVSYAEIYNETVNDLLNPSKRNLEIRESVLKGVFVNNLTEMEVDSYEKVLSVLNTGENNRVIAETKLNEKSSRSHTIFRMAIEFERKEGTEVKKYSAQLNLGDLAGSENVSKAKSEGIRLREGTNINKSLLALSNVINRLSQNGKQFVNYRDSKLTRLLQSSLGGNSKTIIICTIVDDNVHYSETVNTLHFGLKAKNVKTTVRINEVIDDKGKIILENNQLKSKIKMLQEMINEKKAKGNKCMIKSNSNNNICNTSHKITSRNLTSLLCTADKKSNEDKGGNEQINAMEKEVALLKRLLVNNKEELGEDIMNHSVNNDLYSVQSGNLYYNLTQSEYKTMYNRMPGMGNQFQESSAMKSTFNPYCQMYSSDNNILQDVSMSAYRRGCMTELRGFTQPNNNSYYQNSSMHKTASKVYNNINAFGGFGNQGECEFHAGGDLHKENEELRRNIYEMRKTYYEVLQSKENQIKLLNQNHNMTLENCEKLIKEAEDNYLNLKLNYDQAQEQIKVKDEEIKELINKNINQESMVNYYKDEIAKMKDLHFVDDLQLTNNELQDENEKLKMLNQEVRNSLQVKENECNNLKEEIKNMNKKQEKEILKLKNEMKHKIGININKKGNNLCKENDDNHNKIILEYENKISKLEIENNEYKNSIKNIKETQIVEYQKLLDESFDKIRELNKELFEYKEKIQYYEKTFTVIEKIKPSQENIKHELLQTNNKEISLDEHQYTPHHLNDNSNVIINNSNKSTNPKLLSKKRKILPKIYHSIIDKNSTKTPKQHSSINSSKENVNVTNITSSLTSNEISTFQI